MSSESEESAIRVVIEARMHKLMKKIEEIVYSNRIATFNVKYGRYTEELRELAMCRKILNSGNAEMKKRLVDYRDTIYRAKKKYDWEMEQPKIEEEEMEEIEITYN